MEIEYKNTIDDITEFGKFHIDHSESIKKRFQTMRYLFIIVLLIILALVSWAAHSITYLYVGIIGSIIAFLYYPKIMKIFLSNSLKRTYTNGNNKGVFTTHRLSIFPEKLVINNEYSNSNVSWELIERILENDLYVFIYTSSNSALIIPKKAVANDLLVDFISLAKKYVQKTNNKELANNSME